MSLLHDQKPRGRRALRERNLSAHSCRDLVAAFANRPQNPPQREEVHDTGRGSAALPVTSVHVTPSGGA